MRLICLTGGIAGGKSTVGRIFTEMGAVVEDADEHAKSLALKPSIRDALTEALGISFYSSSGELKHSELSEYIFNNPDALKKVNAVIHPPVIAEIDLRFESARSDTGCFVVETALAVETGYADRFEVVIAVVAPRATRLRRLVDKGSLSPDQAALRMDVQLPQEVIIRRADYVLVNDGSLEELREKSKTLFKEICTDE